MGFFFYAYSIAVLGHTAPFPEDVAKACFVLHFPGEVHYMQQGMGSWSCAPGLELYV